MITIKPVYVKAGPGRLGHFGPKRASLRQYHTSPFKAAKRERIAGICHVERSRRAGEGAVENIPAQPVVKNADTGSSSESAHCFISINARGNPGENAFLLHRQNLIFGMFRLQDAIKYARLFAQHDMVLTVFIEPIIYWLDGPFPEHAGFPWFPACRL
jgi:hypothetical protein